MAMTGMQSKKEEWGVRDTKKKEKKKSAWQTWSEAQRAKCFQEALMGVKQPYGYAAARMLRCVWHVLGTQSSRVAEAAAAQQEEPEADLPCVGCCRCRPPLLRRAHSVSVHSMWRDRIVIAPCLHESSVHALCFICLWLTSPVVAWSAQLLRGTGSRSWACLVQGAASAFLDEKKRDTTV